MELQRGSQGAHGLRVARRSCSAGGAARAGVCEISAIGSGNVLQVELASWGGDGPGDGQVGGASGWGQGEGG